MTSPTTPEPGPAPELVSESPGRRSGKPFVVATLCLFVAVPLLVYAARAVLISIEPSNDIELVWAERGGWPDQPIKAATLRSGPMSAMRTGSEFRKIRFDLPAEAESMLQRAATIARSPAVLDSPRGAEQLAGLLGEWDALQAALAVEGSPGLDGDTRPVALHRFYVEYLLGVRAARLGQDEEAARWFGLAFDHAPAALIQRYLDGAGLPAVRAMAPPQAIGLDRVLEGVRDTSLVLHFPAQPTDALGQVYWPVYPMIYREADPAALPGEVVEADEAWFTFPGPVGRMPDVPMAARGPATAEPQAVPSSP
ncbi:MAG: hypothetical protein AAF288_08880 [Planctomycetota bacterium]